jgi:plastocyanin
VSRRPGREGARGSARTLLPRLALLGAVAVAGAGGPAPKTHAVAIRDFRYAPPVLTVRVGDSVVWTNEDIVPHTATAEAGRLDSGSLGTKESWRYTAVKKGKYAYGCTFHPNMKGTLVVR